MVWVKARENIYIGDKRLSNVDDFGWSAPPFQTSLSRGYWMAKYPFTRSHLTSIGIKAEGNINFPLVQISWLNAIEICKKLNQKYRDNIPVGYLFSLPTEVQWEHACRAGTSTLHYFSDKREDLVQIAQAHSEGKEFRYDAFVDVGLKQPNSLGLYDMLGGCLEWCFDIVTEYPVGESFDKTDWLGQKYSRFWLLEIDYDEPETYQGRHRILRGAESSAYRIYTSTGDKSYSEYLQIGFRPCLRPITEWDK